MSGRRAAFGMYNIRIHHIVFELWVTEEERKKMNKIDFLRLVFSALLKVSETYRVDLAIEQPRVVCRHFAHLCFVFLGAAPIPYVVLPFFLLLPEFKVRGFIATNLRDSKSLRFQWPKCLTSLDYQEVQKWAPIHQGEKVSEKTSFRVGMELKKV